MAHMTWKDEYSVGVALLDEDHKRLLEILNHLHDSLREEETAETLASVCDKLVDHMLASFGQEERYFAQTNYPQAATHRLMHEQLKQCLLQFRREIGKCPLPLGQLYFFTDWLPHHIMGEDKQLGVHLNAQGIY